VVSLWAAARLSSGLARTSAALGTAGLGIFAAASTIPIVVSDAIPGSRHLPTFALVLLALALVVGIAAWVRDAHPLYVARAVAAVATVAALLLLPYFGPLPSVNPLPLIAIAVTTGIVLQVRGRGSRATRRTRTVVIVASTLLLVLLALELVDMLVVTPLWLSDGDLSSVYALPAVVTGVGILVAWAIAAFVVVLLYLVLGLRFARSLVPQSALFLGLALGAVVLLSASMAGTDLWLRLYEIFAPSHLGPSDAPRLSLYLYVAGVVMLAVAALSGLAPRSWRATGSVPEAAPNP